jgi:xanthine dehydrogenase small subunit
MTPIAFLLNDRERSVNGSCGTVLLDVLRENLGLTGTKDGCREGDCGTCLVLLGTPRPNGVVYDAVNACLLPLGEAEGRHVVTVEGLNQPELTPVQQALVDESAIQCGFCTPGLVVALTGFLLGGAAPTEAEGTAALSGNICRCTGHVAIRRTITRLCQQFQGLETMGKPSSTARIEALVDRGVLPRYFLEVSSRLQRLFTARPFAAEMRARIINPGADTAVANPGKKPGSPADARGIADAPSSAVAEIVPAKVEGEEGEACSPILVAGGTDLLVTRADELAAAELTFLSRREDLQGLRVEGGHCRIGAATSLSAIEASPVIRGLFPDWGRPFDRIASRPIRNRATIAGNIVNASPAGDLSVMFLALNAAVVLAHGDRKRTVALRDFFRGYKVLDLAADEMIAEILFPVPDAVTHFNFEKVSRRDHLDIASVNSAIRLTVRDDRIVEAHAAAGSVAPIPLYLKKTSAFLGGRPIAAATARGAAAEAGNEISPISDVRGSAEYKRALLPRLILAHFLRLFPDRVREEDLG